MSRQDVDGLNAGYASLLLEEYLGNPAAVPAEWRELFESGDSELVEALPGLARLLENGGGNGAAVEAASPPAPPAPVAEPDAELLGGVAAAMALVKAYRMVGHLAARLDPLGSEPPGDPALDPMALIPRLTPELQARIPASVLRMYVPAETLADALPQLQETYTGTIAYEIEHISDHEKRVWLRQAIESGRYRTPLSPDERRALLGRLSEVEGMEAYLRRSFLGQKQFSLEGLDVMIPMLDESIELAAEDGAHEVVIGMAHRGRLNVLAHTVGRPYETILREFEGERALEAVAADPEGGTGDVKYHLGARAQRATRAGEIAVTLAANPSHLEAADPVVEGTARAFQTDRAGGAGAPRPERRDAGADPRRRLVRRPGRRRRDAQPERARGLLDRRHAAPDREQPGRLHDRSRPGPLDALLERPREGLRHPDRPRERRRPRGGGLGDPARDGVPAPLPPRRRRRPGRLPALRPQRAGRGRLHAAADGRGDQRARDRAGAVRGAARRRGRRHAGRGRGARGRGRRLDEGGPRGVARVVRHRPRRARGAAARTPPRGRPRPLSPPSGCASSTPSCCWSRTASPSIRSSRASSTGASRRSTRAGSTGARPRRSRTARSCARGSRSASPARTRSAAPSRTATSSSTTCTRARRTCRCSTSATAPPRSRSRTRRCPSSPASASSTATRSPHRRRSCSGRRSSATSSTARRS